jgi:hypothetical protein
VRQPPRMCAWVGVSFVSALMCGSRARRRQTCVLRAWDVTRPVVLCPAMNTHMWDHPHTAQHLAALGAFPWVSVVGPVAKLLACGDLGAHITHTHADRQTDTQREADVCVREGRDGGHGGRGHDRGSDVGVPRPDLCRDGRSTSTGTTSDQRYVNPSVQRTHATFLVSSGPPTPPPHASSSSSSSDSSSAVLCVPPTHQNPTVSVASRTRRLCVSECVCVCV